MIRAWRLCRARYAALDGEGARRFGGRWNTPGRPVVYCAEHPALAVLEVLVHLDLPPEDLPKDYVMLELALPEPVARLDAPLPADPRAAGDAWLVGGGAPVLRVPSVLVPQAANLLLNPRHPAAIDAREVARSPFGFDVRLLYRP